MYSCHTGVQLSHWCTVVIPVYSCHTGVQLSYRCTVVIPVYSCHTVVQLSYWCTIVIPVYSCHTGVQLSYRCTVVIPVYSCHTGVQLSYWCTVVIPVYSCQTSVQLSYYCPLPASIPTVTVPFPLLHTRHLYHYSPLYTAFYITSPTFVTSKIFTRRNLPELRTCAGSRDVVPLHGGGSLATDHVHGALYRSDTPIGHRKASLTLVGAGGAVQVGGVTGIWGAMGLGRRRGAVHL